MTDKQTSRHWVIDMVENIGNLIAMTSHWQELINATPPEGMSMSEKEEYYEKLNWYNTMMEKSVSMRRDCMSLLDKQDGDMRCIVKHAIASYTYSCELYYANFNDPEFQELQHRSAEYMYECLSRFLGMDLVKCGRCLNDELEGQEMMDAIDDLE